MPQIIEIVVAKLLTQTGEAARATVVIKQGDWTHTEDFFGKTHTEYARTVIVPNAVEEITVELMFCNSPSTVVSAYVGDGRVNKIPVRPMHAHMTHDPLSALRIAHEKYIRSGVFNVLSFPAPCCGALLQTPDIDGDTLAVCTNCGKTYYRTVCDSVVCAVAL